MDGSNPKNDLLWKILENFPFTEIIKRIRILS